MRTILAVAPHPDDETLGCGGTLLRHVADGDRVHWLIATSSGLEGQERQIESVANSYGVSAVHRLHVAPARMDVEPLFDLVRAASSVFEKVAPQVVYLPHPGDAHSDHRRTFQMCISGSKWFRQPSIEEIYAYETLSETGFDIGFGASFRPSAYVDIGEVLERKIEILEAYRSELSSFPFPRSAEAVRALAMLRGAESGFVAAEAFATLRLRR